jgi:hypothetical protein
VGVGVLVGVFVGVDVFVGVGVLVLVGGIPACTEAIFVSENKYKRLMVRQNIPSIAAALLIILPSYSVNGIH